MLFGPACRVGVNFDHALMAAGDQALTRLREKRMAEQSIQH